MEGEPSSSGIEPFYYWIVRSRRVPVAKCFRVSDTAVRNRYNRRMPRLVLPRLAWSAKWKKVTTTVVYRQPLISPCQGIHSNSRVAPRSCNFSAIWSRVHALAAQLHCRAMHSRDHASLHLDNASYDRYRDTFCDTESWYRCREIDRK